MIHMLDHQKAREFQKNFCFCFIDYAKVFTCVDHNKLWNLPKPGIKSKSPAWQADSPLLDH